MRTFLFIASRDKCSLYSYDVTPTNKRCCSSAFQSCLLPSSNLNCNCKSGCRSRCGCRKAGLQCSLACVQCNGQACLNAVAYETDVNEDRTFDPEIMEQLETNVIEYDNEDNNDLETLELREDDDDEEDEN
nr:unnamed protein product [Callosobruchus analis]